MAVVQYELRYYNCEGTFQFALEDIISINYGRKKNEEGICVVELSGASYALTSFDRDGILEIYRTNPITNITKLAGETCWFLRKVEISINSECETIYTLTFYDTITLIGRRIIAWDGVAAANYPSIMLEPLDDILNLIMRYNFGGGTTDPVYANAGIPFYTPGGVFALAPPIDSWQIKEYGTVQADLVNRQFPLISIPRPNSQSTIPNTHRFELKNCLNAMQEIAEASDLLGESLWYDIEFLPSTSSSFAQFNFKTWVGVRGVDRTSGINLLTVGPEFGNLNNSKITYDWEDETTVMYVSGNGDDDLKDMAAVSVDAPNCPFYDIENIVSASFGLGANVHNTPELESAGRVELAKQQPKIGMSGDIISTKEFQFFDDFGYGDLVVAKFREFSQIVEVAEFNVSVDESGEEISIPLSV